MKLNPDCIRDILLFVESSTDISNNCDFNSDIVAKHFPNYSFDDVMYHIRQCELSNFFYNSSHSLGYQTYCICDLTPEAHKFLANIRDNNTWNGIKSIAEKIGSISLDALIQIASNVVTELIKSYFGLP